LPAHQLLEKACGPLVQQGYDICSLRYPGGKIPEEDAQIPNYEKVHGDGLQNVRALHLDRHRLSRGPKLALIDLGTLQHMGGTQRGGAL
jgi:hypothetical protein